MPKFSKENAILENGIYLPEFLFDPVTATQKNISPKASLNPAAAISGGNGFQSSTTPSATRKKRTLIIDANSFTSHPEYGERIALVKRLQIAGFEIFLRSTVMADNGSYFYKIGKNLENIENLQCLSTFNEVTDYEDLIKHNVTYDKILLLNQAREIEQAFSQNEYVETFSGNDWKCDFPAFSAIDLLNNSNCSAKDKKFYEKAAFTLQRIPKNLEKEAIVRMSEHILNVEEDWNQVDPISGVSYKEDFVSGVSLILNAAPHLRSLLLESFENISRKKGLLDSSTSIKSFLLNQAADSKTSVAQWQALQARDGASMQSDYNLNLFDEIHRLESSNPSALNHFSPFFELITEFVDNVPEAKSHFVEMLKPDTRINPHDSSLINILNHIYRGEESKSLEAFQPFIDSANQLIFNSKKNGEISDAAAKNYYIILDKYTYLSLFAKNSAEGPAKRFFESKFLENFTYDFAQTLNSPNDTTLIAQIIELAPSRIGDQIVDLVFAREALQETMSITSALVKIRPERAEEFLDFGGKRLPSSFLNGFLNGLPPAFKKYCHEILNQPVEHYITYEDLKNTNYLRDVDNRPQQTYLQIANLGKNDQRFESLKNEDFQNIAVARISSSNIAEDFDATMSYLKDIRHQLPSLKHLIFSDNFLNYPRFKESLTNILDGSEISYDFFDAENYLGIGSLIAKTKSSQGQQNQAPIAQKKNRKQIRVAIGATSEEIDPSNNDSTQYLMSLAGEVFNGDSDKLLIRTQILKHDISTSLKQEEYVPKEFTEISSLHQITDLDINNFSNAPKDGEIYCHFRQQLVANKRFRLLSVNAAEEFMGIVGATNQIIIERGDDDFFYATSATNRTLEYVIKAPNPQLDLDLYQTLPDENPVKKIIDDYRDPSKGFTFIADPNNKLKEYSAENHQEWMEDSFAKRSGVCRHRVAAVEYKLKMSGIDEDSFRRVSINNNHVVLEIKNENEKWIKVDFGGGAQASKINLPQNVVYNSSEVTASEPLPREESSAEVMSKFLCAAKFQQINNPQDLHSFALNPENKNTLVATSTIEQHGNFFIEQARNAQRPIFYIDHPSKIDLGSANIFINDEEVAVIKQEGLLADFLQNTSVDPLNPPIILINWEAFAPAQKLALNSILDLKRKLNGIEIADSFQIIGLCNSASKDPSFLSRHNLLVESQTTFLKTNSQNLDEIQTIDLEGFPDWRRHLFGKIIVEGNQMTWQKSQFVTDLESGKSNFEIINLSPEAAKDLQYEFNQAKAAGKFIYHGHEIACPQNSEIKCPVSSFDFTKFNNNDDCPIYIDKNFTFDQTPSDCHLINTYLFDALLCDKRIENGLYFEEKGLIEKCAATTDQVLHLFISSNLSDSQWYCLFNEAQKNNVCLDLFLAPQIDLPKDLKFSTTDPVEFPNLNKRAQIFVSNDPDKTLKEHQFKNLFAVIDVEDCTYQDLIERIGFDITATNFENFRTTQSELFTNREEGKKIVLKGEFAPDLLRMLEPILTNDINQNLILIIEDKTCQKNTAFEPLKWLRRSDYRIETYELDKVNSTRLLPPETPSFEYDLSNSAAEAQEFIHKRKRLFLDALKEQPLLQLMGESGVGKSQLLREFERNDSDTVLVYRELTNFRDWATKDQSNKIKILFIDESNIADLHFTTFEPLKNGGAKEVFFQGKFFDLDESRKVVFACNPVEYGGGRFAQKLFRDGGITAFPMEDFPACYIYEKILKESIYDKIDPKIRETISESLFKEDCEVELENYLKNKNLTVRELQEVILISFSNWIDEKITFKKNSEVITENFISTAATLEVETALGKAIDVRQKQREGIFPHEAVGLNAVIIEGDSGTGKSELIQAVLKSRGISEKKLGEEKKPEQQFYKIEASQPLEQKRAIIAKAFEEGNVVWIDEINSCIDDGLEKILNAALTGEHPDGKKDQPCAGFMLISSTNSAALEGRSIISPALQHRSTMPVTKSLQEYSLEDLSQIVNHWLEPKHINPLIGHKIAQDFQTLLHLNEGKNLNLRTLRSSLEEILPIYAKLARLEKPSADFHTTTTKRLFHNVNITPERQ